MSAATPLGAPHVLMTTDTVGGVWTYALDLGRELVRAGVRVTLAVIGPAPDEARRTQAQAAGLEMRDLGGELDWTAADEAEVAASAARLFAFTADLRPHLLHLNSPAPGRLRSLPRPGARRLPFLRDDLVVGGEGRGAAPARPRLARPPDR